MSKTTDAELAREALASRLRAAAAVLIDHELPEADPDPALDAAVILDLVVRDVHAKPSTDRIWLLFAAISSSLPTSDEVRSVMRELELSTVEAATLWLLDVCLEAAASGSPKREMIIISDGVIVDVDHSAQYDLHTGIQQVVRSTVPRWESEHDITLAAWTPGRTAYRALDRSEHDRIRNWEAREEAPPTASDSLALIVPWHSTVVLAEVPPGTSCDRLAALAQFSGNRLVAIGYDCIPIVSAEMVPLEEPNRFARYLSMIKYAHRVAAISVSATAEFSGFAAALPTQGLVGPTVFECLLPAERIPADSTVTYASGTNGPDVLSVGSFEPRKNHAALLYAAERLWREGERFHLHLIGGSGWGHELPARVRQLQSRGYALTLERNVSNAALAAAYQNARFSVFASLHEGYGLPVAESIAFGTPVITSAYGSTREIGEGRGAELIDPRDDEALVSAMRTLLRDDDRLTELRRQTQASANRSWDDYARDIWRGLVGETTEPAEVTS